MKKIKKVLVVTLVMALAAASLGACGQKTKTPETAAKEPEKVESSAAAESQEPDTITALLPPISSQYLDRISEIEAEFHQLYPNLTLKIEPASWDDRIQKLDTQVNAGSPPDIAFLNSNTIPKYVDMGMALDITPYMTAEMLEDYDEGPLEYMKNGAGLYGLPLYMEIHGIGGNKEFMDEVGIDWKKIQTTGWTYEEFREAIKKGVVTENGETSRYGFVFACAGGPVIKNYIEIFSKCAGMPERFDENLKYTYTSKEFLSLLEAMRTMIDDGSMPKELSSVTAGMRWNMFLTGKTMITGKGLATFETMAKQNNEKIAADDGSSVEDSIPVEYVVLPVPAFNGAEPNYYAAVDGFVTFRGKKEPTEEHIGNVVKAVNFLASGKMAAQVNSELFATNITDSGRKESGAFPVERDADNSAATEYLMKNASPARPDITADLISKATKIEDEVIVPKFQALLADEITPEEMHEEIVKAAIEVFGEDGIVRN